MKLMKVNWMGNYYRFMYVNLFLHALHGFFLDFILNKWSIVDCDIAMSLKCDNSDFLRYHEILR